MVRFKFILVDGGNLEQRCLNSTMVRFKLSCRRILGIDPASLNSTMVRFKSNWYNDNSTKSFSLNSTMVRFKSGNTSTTPAILRGSQFHYGSIQMHRNTCRNKTRIQSQFHYGSIQMIEQPHQKEYREMCLNSTMVRFKWIYFSLIGIRWICLNSTMVRFKF